MLKWLRDLIVPIAADDPLFGKMQYHRDVELWEGSAMFRPLGRVVEVLIWCGRSGPTPEQRAFFEYAQRHYDAIAPEVANQLSAEASRIGIGSTTLDLVAVSIPKRPADDAEWELAYDSRSSQWHFRVQMRGLTPQSVIGEC